MTLKKGVNLSKNSLQHTGNYLRSCAVWNDNINTLDADAELRLTIMSSIAQEESRKISERIKWGQRRQMERGFAFGRGVLGYRLKNGKLTINESEAKIVRLIFDLYVSGMGLHLISKELEIEALPRRVAKHAGIMQPFD